MLQLNSYSKKYYNTQPDESLHLRPAVFAKVPTTAPDGVVCLVGTSTSWSFWGFGGLSGIGFIGYRV